MRELFVNRACTRLIAGHKQSAPTVIDTPVAGADCIRECIRRPIRACEALLRPIDAPCRSGLHPRSCTDDRYATITPQTGPG